MSDSESEFDIFGSDLDSSDEENYEELHKLLVDEFDRLIYKNCVNLKDVDHVEEMTRFHENGKVNDKIDSNIESYKILMKSMSGEETYGKITALYVPKHIKAIYIDHMYRIPIENDLFENDNIEDLLEKSKQLPEYETFNERYKKVILMKPYIPENTVISFDESDMYYYETIIRDVEFRHDIFDGGRIKVVINDIYFYDHVDNMEEKHGHLTFWVNYINDYAKLLIHFSEDDDIYQKLKFRNGYKRSNYETLLNVSQMDTIKENQVVKIALYRNMAILSMYIKNTDEFDVNKTGNLTDLEMFKTMNNIVSSIVFAEQESESE